MPRESLSFTSFWSMSVWSRPVHSYSIFLFAQTLSLTSFLGLEFPPSRPRDKLEEEGQDVSKEGIKPSDTYVGEGHSSPWSNLCRTMGNMPRNWPRGHGGLVPYPLSNESHRPSSLVECRPLLFWLLSRASSEVPEKALGVGRGRESWTREQVTEHHSCGSAKGLWGRNSTVAQMRGEGS